MQRLKRTFALLLVLGTLLAVTSVQASAAEYWDVPVTHWAYSSIKTTASRGVLQGVGGGAFGIGTPMSRAAYVTALCRLMDWETVTPEKGEPYIRVEGLHIDKVKFHPDKKLLQKVNQDFFATRSQLTGTVTPNERIFNEEERLALLNQYFTEYRSITIKEYADLTALPHTAASKELHAMAASPNATLSIEGGGSHIRFTEKRE